MSRSSIDSQARSFGRVLVSKFLRTLHGPLSGTDEIYPQFPFTVIVSCTLHRDPGPQPCRGPSAQRGRLDKPTTIDGTVTVLSTCSDDRMFGDSFWRRVVLEVRLENQ